MLAENTAIFYFFLARVHRQCNVSVCRFNPQLGQTIKLNIIKLVFVASLLKACNI